MVSLLNRHKFLLALIQAFEGNVPSTDLQKYLFLFSREYPQFKTYEFVPYKYGAFSFTSHADKRKLVAAGLLNNNDGYWNINNTDINYIKQLDTQLYRSLLKFSAKFKSIQGHDLIRLAYTKYPYFAINSDILEDNLTKEKQNKVLQAKSQQKEQVLFTIGYEGITIEAYLNKLIENNVKLLCDVRKNPMSRKYGFSKLKLAENLSKLKIKYKHIPELGIPTDLRSDLSNPADYNELFIKYNADILSKCTKALNSLHEMLMQDQRIAITCFEADPQMCHRSHVAEALSKLPNWNYKISHIK